MLGCCGELTLADDAGEVLTMPSQMCFFSVNRIKVYPPRFTERKVWLVWTCTRETVRGIHDTQRSTLPVPTSTFMKLV